ncbi:zinc ribbon domain-containing protein [bacterium]|nr:zinc ribbon domain-containing protein [bacterium]
MAGKKSTEIFIPSTLVGHLFRFLREPPDNLYPFPINDKSPSDAETRELLENGILDKTGNLANDPQKLLAIMGKARSMARFKFLAEGDLMEYRVFFGKNTGASASLRQNAKGFLLDSPAPSRELLEAITDFSGSGMSGVVPPLGEMPISVALCALSAADLTRRELLLALGSDSPWKPSGLTPEKILTLLKRDDLNSGWLLWLLKTVLWHELSADQRSVDTAFADLSRMGFLEKRNGEYVPGNQLLVLCRRMMILNFFYRIDAVRLAGNGDAIRQAFTVVQNGNRDILYLEATETTVFMTGLSGRALMSLLENYLTNPEAIPAREPLTEGKSASSCSKCGKPLETDAGFCKFCGASQRKDDEKPRFCSGCGANLKPEKSFCSKCGKPVS